MRNYINTLTHLSIDSKDSMCIYVHIHMQNTYAYDLSKRHHHHPCCSMATPIHSHWFEDAALALPLPDIWYIWRHEWEIEALNNKRLDFNGVHWLGLQHALLDVAGRFLVKCSLFTMKQSSQNDVTEAMCCVAWLQLHGSSHPPEPQNPRETSGM